MDHPSFWKVGPNASHPKMNTNLDCKASTPRLSSDLAGGSLPFAQQLTKNEETDLFIQMNYARFRFSQEISQAKKRRITLKKAREMLHWHHLETNARASLVHSNLPLVLCMAKKARISGVDFTEIVSEGNMALLRAIDGFDCSRGFKFSTYACRAILRSFAGLATRNNKYRLRFPTLFDDYLETSVWPDLQRQETKEYYTEELVKILDSNAADLTAVELTVIKGRFALGRNSARMTLVNMGQALGLSKERIRQIQKKAVGKLRKSLEERLTATQTPANSPCYAAG